MDVYESDAGYELELFYVLSEDVLHMIRRRHEARRRLEKEEAVSWLHSDGDDDTSSE